MQKVNHRANSNEYTTTERRDTVTCTLNKTNRATKLAFQCLCVLCGAAWTQCLHGMWCNIKNNNLLCIGDTNRVAKGTLSTQLFPCDVVVYMANTESHRLRMLSCQQKLALCLLAKGKRLSTVVCALIGFFPYRHVNIVF